MNILDLAAIALMLVLAKRGGIGSAGERKEWGRRIH